MLPFKRYALRLISFSFFRNQFRGELVSIHGMLVRLLAEFVSCQVIFFAMGHGSGRVGMGRKVV
jgi:hypothetical protein